MIKRDYELGAILTIISLLLNLFLYFAAHEIKIREILIQTFNINDLEATEKRFVHLNYRGGWYEKKSQEIFLKSKKRKNECGNYRKRA